jgi:hypothetical protein
MGSGAAFADRSFRTPVGCCGRPWYLPSKLATSCSSRKLSQPASNHLRDRGLKAGEDFHVDPDGSVQPNWIQWSTNGVDRTVTTDAKAPVPAGGVPVADVELKVVVHMHGEYRFSLDMSGVSAKEMRDPTALSDHIRSWFLRNNWDTRWIIVTHVYTAARATLLTSGNRSTNTAFDFEGKAPPVPGVQINLATGFTMGDTAEGASVIPGAENVTPVFEGRRASLWDIVTNKPLQPVGSLRLFGEDPIDPNDIDVHWEPVTIDEAGDINLVSS